MKVILIINEKFWFFIIIENELEKIKIENSRVMKKYLEIKDENKEIIDKIQELSKF